MIEGVAGVSAAGGGSSTVTDEDSWRSEASKELSGVSKRLPTPPFFACGAVSGRV